MPTYEYACRSCGEHLEVVQSFRDEPLRECPACGGELRKVFSPVGISFKGSGFYRNDSRAASKTAKADGRDRSEATSSSSESSDSKSTDAKSTDAKSPPKQDTAKKESKPEAKTA